MNITRTPDPKLAKAMRDNQVFPEPWLNVLDDATRARVHEDKMWLMHIRHYYHWTSTVAKQVFGSSDGYVQGRCRYAIYKFRAEKDGIVQDFVLYTYPAKSGRGSSIELLAPYHPQLVPEIIEWLHQNHPYTLEKTGTNG